MLASDINDKVGIYIESYGEWTDFNENNISANTGIGYLVNNNLQLDFSIGTGINHNMNYMALGASWLIEKKEKETNSL